LSIFNIFSKRQKALRGETPDVYQYDDLPHTFRAQVVHILVDVFGDPHLYESQTNEAFEQIHKILCREYGVFRLSTNTQDFRAAMFDFLGSSQSYEQALDVIEISFRMAQIFHEHGTFTRYAKPTMTADRGD